MKRISSFCSYQMTRPPRRLDSTQYDENSQNWPKLNIKQLARATFFRILKKKVSRYSKSAYRTASGKMRGGKIWNKRLNGVRVTLLCIVFQLPAVVRTRNFSTLWLHILLNWRGAASYGSLGAPQVTVYPDIICPSSQSAYRQHCHIEGSW